MQKKIAVIGFDTLSAIALRAILFEIGGYKCNILMSDVEDSILVDQHSVYIVTQSVLLNHLDFFLIRKNKTILVSSEREMSNKLPIAHISMYDSIGDIEYCLKTIVQNQQEEDKEQKLSSREIDVLKGIAEGKINKEIADLLNISVNTVITHRKNISSKLGIRTVSGLSLYAVMNGII